MAAFATHRANQAGRPLRFGPHGFCTSSDWRWWRYWIDQIGPGKRGVLNHPSFTLQFDVVVSSKRDGQHGFDRPPGTHQLRVQRGDFSIHLGCPPLAGFGIDPLLLCFSGTLLLRYTFLFRFSRAPSLRRRPSRLDLQAPLGLKLLPRNGGRHLLPSHAKSLSPSESTGS